MSYKRQTSVPNFIDPSLVVYGKPEVYGKRDIYHSEFMRTIDGNYGSDLDFLSFLYKGNKQYIKIVIEGKQDLFTKLTEFQEGMLITVSESVTNYQKEICYALFVNHNMSLNPLKKETWIFKVNNLTLKEKHEFNWLEYRNYIIDLRK